ncbi:MAG: hypothetical protein H6623_03225 [Bdellovibrionaceae bacterium]|nr:hypothetical protein [Pseudobdellovibrionaceae bacterium]
MRIGFAILSQVLHLSVASGAVFLFTSVVSPIKPVISHPATHLPRMSIRFTEFSLSQAALEDDYYVGDSDEESIPETVPAQELRAGTVEMSIKPNVIQLPTIRMNASTILDLSKTENLPVTVAASNRPESRFLPPPMPEEMGTRQPHHWIEGKIEFTDGLALTSSNDEIHVGWFVDGEAKSEGRVFIKDGTYSIKVGQLQGELIAELVDHTGFVLGEAVIDLERMARERSTSLLTITGVDLKLSPYNFGFKAKTISIYDTPSSRQPVPESEVQIGQHDYSVHTDQKGSVYQEAISAKSSGLLSATKSGYRPTVVIADFAREQHIRMFPSKYLTALFDIISFPQEFRDHGVVWGVVRNRSEPVAGYRVRISGHPEVKPIYFNMYIPDESAAQTSVDGQYAFLGLQEGQYELEILDVTDAVIDTRLVDVQMTAVSLQEFEVARTKTLYIKYFDPFRQQPQAVEFVSLGREDKIFSIETEKSQPVVAFTGNDPLLLFAHKQNSNLDSSTFVSRARKYQDVPVLDHGWFSSLQEKYKMDKEQGIIVGFIDSEEVFNVYLDGVVRDAKTLYFDVQGKIIPEGDLGRQKAGFIFYNTGVGLHTVLIESATGQVSTELAYSTADAIATLYKSF